MKGRARMDGLEEAPVRVAEIGDRVERDVRHRLAEDDVEDEPVVERTGRVADRAREGLARLHREARAVERGVERGVPLRHGAGRRVADRLAEREILEEAAPVGLAHSTISIP